MFKKILTTILIAVLLLPISHHANAQYDTLRSITNPTKDWTITFSHEVHKDTLNAQSIYIESSTKAKHPLTFSLSDDLREITVTPSEKYSYGEQYELVISKEIGSVKGGKLQTEIRMPFSLQGGEHLIDIDVNLNPFMTNVKVTAGKEVKHVQVLLNGQALDLKPGENHLFSRGILGLAAGDALIFRALDANHNVLEEIPYTITN